jgi:Predicted glycosyl hydrolase
MRVGRGRRFHAISVVLVVTGALLGFFGQQAAAQAPEPVREWKLGERTLALGSWGADVFTLQIQLRELGYQLQADGLFGRETQAVVRQFQQDQGLPVTGVVGPLTVERLARVRLHRMETMPYIVQPGDSLWSIARAFDTTMEVLIEINQLPDRPLRVGEEIKVPALARYEVKPGDTLWGIARRFRTTVDAIAKLNGISPDEILRVSTVLLLPRGAVVLPEL